MENWVRDLLTRLQGRGIGMAPYQPLATGWPDSAWELPYCGFGWGMFVGVALIQTIERSVGARPPEAYRNWLGRGTANEIRYPLK